MGTEGGVDQPYILYFSVESYDEDAAPRNTIPLLIGWEIRNEGQREEI